MYTCITFVRNGSGGLIKTGDDYVTVLFEHGLFMLST